MDLPEACEQVRIVLEDPEFRAGLLQRLRKERSLNPEFKRLFVDGASATEPCLADLLEVDDQILNQYQRLRSYITEHAIAKLPQPAVVAAGDLQPLLLQQLGGIDDKHEDGQWERFVNFALFAIKETELGPTFSLGSWRIFLDAHEVLDKDEVYCSLPNDYELRIDWDPLPAGYLATGGTHIDARVWGTGTKMALEALTASISPIIQSVIRSLRTSTTSVEMDVPKEYSSEDSASAKLIKELTGYTVPPLGYLSAVQPCIALAIRCHYDNSDFAVRVNNAIALAQCAEAHPMEAIAIAFYVSAIEALLCEGTQEKRLQLRTRIPAVLQFQESRRALDRLGRRIEGLYDIRSEAIHGSRLCATQNQLEAAKLLSAAVLRGVLEWAVHCAGESFVPRDDEWAAELRKAAADRGRTGGVPGVTKELSEHIGRFAKSFQLDDN